MKDAKSILTERDVQKVLESYGPGLVSVQICHTCGELRWLSTQSKAPNAVDAEWMDSYFCGRCQEVKSRSPELVDWVLNVLALRAGVLTKRLDALTLTGQEETTP